MSKIVFHLPMEDQCQNFDSFIMINDIHSDIVHAFGGFTRHKIASNWIDTEGVFVHEELWEYTIITSVEFDLILTYLQSILKSVNQQQMYVEIDGTAAIIEQDIIRSYPGVEFPPKRGTKFQMNVEPIWRERDLRVDERLCFVLMPFRDPFNIIYQDHIRPAVERQTLRCVRANDIYGVNRVMEDIWEQICKSKVIVSELTGRNPNVFYETGIAHTIGEKVILLTQTMDDVPFDLRDLRCIVYEYTPRGCMQLEEALERTLQATI